MRISAQESQNHKAASIYCKLMEDAQSRFLTPAVEKNPHFRVFCAAKVAEMRETTIGTVPAKPRQTENRHV